MQTTFGILLTQIRRKKMSYNLGAGTSGAAAGLAAGATLGPWGALAGGAIGALGGFGNKSSGLSAKQQIYLSAVQNQIEENRMKNAHQWEAEDLRKAGFNPALTAAGNSSGSIAGSTPEAGAIMANMANNLMNESEGNANRYLQSAKNAMDFFNQVRTIEKDGELKDAQINNTDADTAAKILNNSIIKKYGSKQAKEQLANTVLMGQEIKANTASKTAEAESINQTIREREPMVMQEENYGKFLRKHPKIATAINTVNRVAEIGGNIMGVAGKAYMPFAAAKAAKNFRPNIEINTYDKRGELSGTKTIRRKK